jgi:predicted metal-binding protein
LLLTKAFALSDSIDAAPQHVTPAPSPDVTILVCVTCRNDESDGPRPGQLLFEALQSRLASADPLKIALTPVECLSVCKRPCTLALAAPGKWTYVIGDLDRVANLEDIVEAATRFAAAQDGIVPWRERPKSFRKGVVSRTPPLLFQLPAQLTGP